MLRAILNKSWRQYPTRHQLYGHLPPITKTIQVRRTRNAGHCWRSRDELIRDVLLWTPTHGRAKAGQPARTYIQQLCEDTGCSPEDLPRAMNDREEWRERVRDIRATSATWSWWIHKLDNSADRDYLASFDIFNLFTYKCKHKIIGICVDMLFRNSKTSFVLVNRIRFKISKFDNKTFRNPKSLVYIKILLFGSGSQTVAYNILMIVTRYFIPSS